ncbi:MULTISPECIES: Mbeg1-like protein [unclassified Paenibacillus]|uniref:Mbeg1-like protein n=1 Tax=unclassified Paenibacillus TaxID=185978 RepID=UPI0024756A10|nr:MULTISPECIES: Mbeg1-like protein [unclassified Paenibacillus]MDH6426093.1 pimeloyl-ACP methyl ester carboxylesterase [Paenibacillus sp. PastH-4]MDH6442115.1 pimeloyl-ACP methyl ester carboxylesterase [Paenibacillus sp. PastF-4]MDH6527171.1 esterase/lipase [Paenibacillus sp. PastH-3]
MKLTEQQYITLASVVEAADGLELTDSLAFAGAAAYAYRDEHDDRLIIFTYKGKDWLADLQSLLSGQSSMPEEASRFLLKNKGEKDCQVTGYSMGGALALYAATVNEGIGGVVFDAPGIANILTVEQKGKLQVKNIVAYNSLVSALGKHNEEIVFAKSGIEETEFLIPDSLWQRYTFDAEGNVIIGEKGNAYALLSKINILTEEHTPVFDAVMSGFGDTVGLTESASDHLGYVIFTLIDQLDVGKVRGALIEIAHKYERMLDAKFSEWRTEMNNIPESFLFDDIRAKFEQLSEAAMLEAAGIAEELNEITQAVLSILLICSPVGDKLMDHVEEWLNKLTNALMERMEKLTNQMTLHLDKVVETTMNQMLKFPELKLDFEF